MLSKIPPPSLQLLELGVTDAYMQPYPEVKTKTKQTLQARTSTGIIMIMLAVNVTWDLTFISVTESGRAINNCVIGLYRWVLEGHPGLDAKVMTNEWSTKKHCLVENKSQEWIIVTSLLTTCSLSSTSRAYWNVAHSRRTGRASWVPCVWLTYSRLWNCNGCSLTHPHSLISFTAFNLENVTHAN